MTDYPESAEAAQASPTVLAPNSRDPWDGSPVDRPTLYVSEDMPPLVADDADALLAALDRARTALGEEFPHLATLSPLDAARSLYGTAHGAVPYESVPAEYRRALAEMVVAMTPVDPMDDEEHTTRVQNAEARIIAPPVRPLPDHTNPTGHWCPWSACTTRSGEYPDCGEVQ